MNRPQVSWEDEKFLAEWAQSAEDVHLSANLNGENMITVQRPKRKDNNTIKGVQFLSPRHVIEAGNKLDLKVSEVTTTEPDNYGNPIVIYFVDAKAIQYSKGFNTTSDNLADICDILGNDETKWGGKILTVTVETNKRGAEKLKFSKQVSTKK